MKIKTLLIVSAIGIALATPESLQAQAKPKPVKPDVGDVKDDAKEVARNARNSMLQKSRSASRPPLKSAKRIAATPRSTATRSRARVEKVGAFGKLVRDDEKIKELRESFKAAAKEQHEKVKDLHKQLKDASDEDKDGLRDSAEGSAR